MTEDIEKEIEELTNRLKEGLEKKCDKCLVRERLNDFEWQKNRIAELEADIKRLKLKREKELLEKIKEIAFREMGERTRRGSGDDQAYVDGIYEQLKEDNNSNILVEIVFRLCKICFLNQEGELITETFQKDGKVYDINTEEGRKKFLGDKEILFLCCFCGKGMKEEEANVVIMLSNARQTYWSHRKCLIERLHKSAREQLK